LSAPLIYSISSGEVDVFNTVAKMLTSSTLIAGSFVEYEVIALDQFKNVINASAAI
jgi:hypothetical protein